jgi:hypothetical protein
MTSGRSDAHELALAEPGGLVAERAHLVDGVGDDDDGTALAAEVGELLGALLLEGHVADGQDLVDEQDVGLDVDRHGEPEPHVHAGGVVLHGLVDEVATPEKSTIESNFPSISALLIPRMAPLR